VFYKLGLTWAGKIWVIEKHCINSLRFDTCLTCINRKTLCKYTWNINHGFFEYCKKHRLQPNARNAGIWNAGIVVGWNARKEHDLETINLDGTDKYGHQWRQVRSVNLRRR
jgi:hypothetical protein